MVISTELLGIKNALAEKKELKAKKTGKVAYPNPKFFKMKDHMDWKKQGENLMEVVGICTEMFKEADHKAFWKLQLDRTKNDLERVALEFKQAMEMTPEERKDIFLHGEKTLGKLYRKGDMATVRREWKGAADTL